MSHILDPQVAALADAYARDLARCLPGRGLDARIDRLVAAPPKIVRVAPAQRPASRGQFAAAACVGALAVAAGVFIGVRVERAAAPPLAVTSSRDPAWPPPDFSMWPTDSVALKIPAEVSAHGTLVAVNGKTRSAGTRYWVDIVVSNDGTVRIENVVPAGEDKHGLDTQNP